MGRQSVEAQEARLALWMLIPALFIVFSIVLFPVALNFWVSFKPVRLGDLRPPTPIVRERVDIVENESGQQIARVRYQIRNSNPNKPISNVILKDSYPALLVPQESPAPFELAEGEIDGMLDYLEGGYSERFELVFLIVGNITANELEEQLLESLPQVSATSENILTNFRFTLDNYRLAISTRQIGPAIGTTILYAFCGSFGALLLGLCASLLVNQQFFGRGLIRGLFLFPYVVPIVAVAFVWTFLLDPISGTINELLLTLGVIQEPINFLSVRPTALLSAIFFDAWRYFPFCYLFILARLKAIPQVLYESVQIDGAGVLSTFWHITLPQIRTVMAAIFLLRFIWTFNRFDDIFLLTGGASGTQTLPIQVFDQAIGAGNIGAGAATAVLLFLMLTIFLVGYVFLNKRLGAES